MDYLYRLKFFMLLGCAVEEFTAAHWREQWWYPFRLRAPAMKHESEQYHRGSQTPVLGPMWSIKGRRENGAGTSAYYSSLLGSPGLFENKECGRA